MNPYKHHGEYLHDHTDAGALRRDHDIPIVEAEAALQLSPWVRRNERVTQSDPIINKGFAVVARNGDRCAIVNHHDGRYTFWTGSWAYFSEKFGLA